MPNGLAKPNHGRAPKRSRHLTKIMVMATLIVITTTTNLDVSERPTADAQSFTSVCNRNAGIRDAILNALTSISNCADVTASHLSNITTIQANNANISSLAASDFDSLRPQHLLLANNRLSAVPTAVVQLMAHATFRTLNLSNNQITQLNQNDFSGATHLRTLRLDGNDFSGANPLHKDTLDPLTNLEQLYINNTGTKSLPSSFLDSLTKLEIFEAKDNALTALPAAIFNNNTALTSVALSGNSLASLDKDTFKSNDRLMTINLGNNALTTLHADIFQRNTALRVLFLSQNKLTAINRKWFRNLSNLQTLTLQTNMIAALDANAFTTTTDGQTYTGPTQLSQILLRDNDIATIHRDALKGLNLWQLTLNDNNIATLPRGIFDGMPRLQTLNLYNNRISRVEAGTFDKQTNLEVLRLDQNQIRSIDANTFNKLNNLMLLRLDRNQINTVDADAFANLGRLRNLYLNDNRIARLPPSLFRAMTDLTSLFLQSNQINEISANTVSRLTNLTDLWLQRNAIQTLHPEAFDRLDNLDRLFLFSNQIGSLPYGIFDGLDLDMLWLQSNPGTPFQLPVRANVRASDKAYISVPHGAVYDIDIQLSATHSNPTTNGAPASSVTVPAGTSASATFDLNPTPGELPRVSVTPGDAPATTCFGSPCYGGFQYVAGGPDPPSGVATTPFVRSIEVSWDKPEAAQGVYYHEVRHRIRSGEWNEWVTVPLQDRRRQSTSFHNLATTTPYHFQVRSYTINGYSQPAATEDWTYVDLPVISRLEPQIVNATIVTGQQVRLTANVFNMQQGNANARFDLQTGPFTTDRPQIQWSDSNGGGAFTTTDTPRTTFYTAPETPSTVIITAEAVPYGVCQGHHAKPADTSSCIATFTIRVAAPGDTKSPTESQPRNPSGQIPTTLSDDSGIEYEVATPEQGGNFQVKDCDTCPTVTVPVGAVPDRTVIGIRATTHVATAWEPSATNQLVIAGEHTLVTAVNHLGEPLTRYALNKPMRVCMPFPPAFRSRLDSVALFELADEPTDNRLLASNVYTSNGKLTICGATSKLPATIAPARLGALEPETSMPNIPDDLPETGGDAPNSLVALVAVMIGMVLTSISLIYHIESARNWARGSLRSK